MLGKVFVSRVLEEFIHEDVELIYGGRFELSVQVEFWLYIEIHIKFN